MLIRQAQSTHVSSNIQKRDNLDKKNTTMILSQTSPQGVPKDHAQLISCPSLLVKNNREDNFRRKKNHLLVISNIMRGTRKYYLKNNYLTLSSKVKVPQRSLRYATHCLMVMHPHTKYHWPSRKIQKVMVRTSFAEKKRKKKSD